MARPRIVEVDYHQFCTQLQLAADTGGRIEKTEKVKWKAWVREHKILEASFMSYASEYGDGAKPVIIASDGDWGGYYVYSDDDQFCLKFVRDAE